MSRLVSFWQFFLALDLDNLRESGQGSTKNTKTHVKRMAVKKTAPVFRAKKQAISVKNKNLVKIKTYLDRAEKIDVFYNLNY